MNLENLAKAICRADQDLDSDYSWEVQFEDGRESYRNMARAARDAYFVLPEPIWQAKRESVAKAMHEADSYRYFLTTTPWNKVELAAQNSWRHAADAALTALGFRRAGDDT